MRIPLQLAGCVLALALNAGLALPCAAAQGGHAFTARQSSRPPKPASPPAKQQRPAQRPQNQQGHAQQREQGRANGGRNNGNGAGRGGQNSPDWNRPAGGAVHADRPPSANTPPKRFNDLSPQEKQRVLNYNRNLQNLSPTQRQEMQNRLQVWQKMTPQQRDHIRNDVLPRWNQMPPDRRRAIQNRLAVLKNMPEGARNQHLNDPNFTRGMSEEDQSTLRDLSHLHVGGAPDSPNE